MVNRLIGRCSAAVLLSLTAAACATAPRPAPEAIADDTPVDAKMLPAEFHNAHIGSDRLRGALPSD